MNHDDFTGYVLAGGKSSRMGTDKAYLELNGETFLERAVITLSKTCFKTKIVLNQSQTNLLEKLPADTDYIFDEIQNRGAIGGIHAAFNDCKSDFAIILAVDLPFVTSEAIEKLKDFSAKSNNSAAIVPIQPDSRFQPLCAIYQIKYCLPKIENLMNQHDSASVRDFLDLILPTYIEGKKLSENQDLFFNVNHLKDFHSIR